jgi:hypothetical protein
LESARRLSERRGGEKAGQELHGGRS